MIPQNQTDFLTNRIVDKLTEFIVNDYDIEITSALKIVYQSKIYQLLQDKDGDLYSQSPSYIYELLKPEIDKEV
ncbi:MAG: hypothetical protein IJ341_07790 [Bacteroidales bacterium]|nr:hypothetical protein [Bacteroidales bacterium]MBQ7819583.1 hypothetical protein [Bacteroidales bacterium]